MSQATSRILVVDDNEALRENLAEALQIEGYDVVAEADGQGALARLGGDPSSFGAVLLDLSMPGMDGHEVIARIREDPRLEKLRVVITTGHTGARTRSGVLADAFLVKPFGIKDVLAALQQIGV